MLKIRDKVFLTLKRKINDKKTCCFYKMYTIFEVLDITLIAELRWSKMGFKKYFFGWSNEFIFIHLVENGKNYPYSEYSHDIHATSSSLNLGATGTRKPKIEEADVFGKGAGKKGNCIVDLF